jgi:hypothetical protein
VAGAEGRAGVGARGRGCWRKRGYTQSGRTCPQQTPAGRMRELTRARRRTSECASEHDEAGRVQKASLRMHMPRTCSCRMWAQPF